MFCLYSANWWLNFWFYNHNAHEIRCLAENTIKLCHSVFVKNEFLTAAHDSDIVSLSIIFPDSNFMRLMLGSVANNMFEMGHPLSIAVYERHIIVCNCQNKSTKVQVYTFIQSKMHTIHPLPAGTRMHSTHFTWKSLEFSYTHHILYCCLLSFGVKVNQ